MHPIVLAICGASGSIYGIRLLQVLLAAGKEVHLTISPGAVSVFETELGISIDLKAFDISQLPSCGDWKHAFGEGRTGGERASHGLDWEEMQKNLRYHHYQDFSAGIASGSFMTAGMVICPCSMGTLAAVSHGMSTNLIHRAADVHLKERRRLVVVPRETPLGSIQLQNMKVLADAGGVILPAMPGFYHRPQSIDDLVDFVVARICDQLEVRVDLFQRWGASPRDRDAGRKS